MSAFSTPQPSGLLPLSLLQALPFPGRESDVYGGGFPQLSALGQGRWQSWSAQALPPPLVTAKGNRWRGERPGLALLSYKGLGVSPSLRGLQTGCISQLELP